MKRDELIKILTENFQNDEEIIILNDNNDKISIEGIVEREFLTNDMYFYVKENGKWVKWGKNICPNQDEEYMRTHGHNSVDSGYEKWWKVKFSKNYKVIFKGLKVKDNS